MSNHPDYTDHEQGRTITLDFLNNPNVEFMINPLVDDTESLYLYGWYTRACNTEVIKAEFTGADLNGHKALQGVPVRNLTTGALIVNPASGTSFLTMTAQPNGGFNSEIPGFNAHAVTMCVGTAAQQDRMVELNHPIVISHGMRSKPMHQLKVRITDLYNQDVVTFTRLVLLLRAFPRAKDPVNHYANAFSGKYMSSEMKGAMAGHW